MRTSLLLVWYIMLFACSEGTNSRSNSDKQPDPLVAKRVHMHTGSMSFVLDDQTYIYNDINWKKSRVNIEEDLRLRLLQDDLPNFEFKLPEIESALVNGERTFSIPDMDRGLKQIQIKFFDEQRKEENKLNKHIVFRAGEVQLKLSKSGNLQIHFEGEGGPMMNREVIFPISGTVKIEI